MNEQDTLVSALYQQKGSYGFAYLDLSSGRFLINEVYSFRRFIGFIAAVKSGRNFICRRSRTGPDSVRELTAKAYVSRPVWEFELSNAKRLLTQQFGTRDLQSFGVEQAPVALMAAGCFNGVCQRHSARSVTAYTLYSP